MLTRAVIWKGGIGPVVICHVTFLEIKDWDGNIFTVTLLMSHYNFSSLIFSSIVMTIFYTPSNIFLRKRKVVSDGRMYVCLRPFTLKVSSVWNSCNFRQQINGVVFKT